MLKVLVLWGLLAQQLLPNPGPLPPPLVNVKREMPAIVKAIYATSSTAHTARIEDLKKLIAGTELNAIVINTKEPSGPKLDEHIRDVVQAFHNQGVWVIGRQVMFQDDNLAALKPELALKRASGQLWHDSGGRVWVDPSSQRVWNYNLEVAKQTLALGFDEINLDYVRFPTDGDVKAIRYPAWDGKTSKEDVLANFASWFHRELRAAYPNVVLSADVFGYSFLKDNDVGMGQRLAKLAPNLDVVAPMVYPSHYSTGNFGFANPAQHPYEVVRQTLERGKPLLTGAPHTLVRPWLQDFNLGATYTAELVRAQMKAINDAGYTAGWMLWNPHNVYTAGALLPKTRPAAAPGNVTTP